MTTACQMQDARRNMEKGSDFVRNRAGIDASNGSTGGCRSSVNGGGRAFDCVSTSILRRIVGRSIKS